MLTEITLRLRNRSHCFSYDMEEEHTLCEVRLMLP